MPTLIAPSAVVTGAPRLPLPYGLFSAFSLRPEGDGRWMNGVRWETPTCAPVSGIGRPYCPPDATNGLPKELDPNGGEVGEASPFSVYGFYRCSALGELDRAQTLANEHLIAREQQRVEQALWTGNLDNVPNLSGANGYPAPYNVGVYSDASGALASLEAWIGNELGTSAVIHMGRGTASLLKNHLESKGGRLYTLLGTPVVAGAGYPGFEMVATPALFGYGSNIFDSSARSGDLLDRTNNDLYAIAERTYVIGFDPCELGKVTFTPPAPGTASDDEASR